MELLDMRDAFAAALFALLLATAGCAGLSNAPGTTPNSTNHTTTQPATSTASHDYPPGVTSNGVVAPRNLTNAHATALHNTSYTVRRTTVTRFENGTLASRVQAVTEHAASEGYYFNYTVNGTVDAFLGGPAGRVETFSNASVTVSAITVASETTYRQRSPGIVRDDFADRLAVLFDAVDTTVAGHSIRDGVTVYSLRATNVTRPSALSSAYGFDAVENVTFTANVTSTGIVRRYHVEFTGVTGNTTRRVTETVTFTRVGSTTVTKPQWVPEALED
jgi:hypothetical protein